MTSKQDWLEFLKTQQAVIQNGKALHFGNGDNTIPEDIAAQTIMAPLDGVGIISVDGEDNAEFLQNQFSNDVRIVDDTHSQLNAYCSPKGRVLSFFRLVKTQQTFYLLLPTERLPATVNRLKMFVLRSKVNVEDVSERLGVLGVAGPRAGEVINSAVSNRPQEIDECVSNNQLTAIKIPGDSSRYLILGPYERLMELWLQSKDRAVPAGANSWTYLNLQAGLPEVYEVNSDEFVPQMLNLHSLNAISFNKGCYPGQEVVARMHYLGKQKRRMYLAHIDTDNSPLPGDSLYSEQNEAGQSVGKIVDVSPSPQGGFDVLAVMQIANLEQGEKILTNQKANLNFKDLPYVVEVEGKK